ncbi:hypothetical protein C0991_010077 [Blastosporella zonata]|nr:hypothetical protein C0991_010077 [Blastosporella zonata]
MAKIMWKIIEDLNIIKCFPHVVNIAVKTGLKYITELAEEDVEAIKEMLQQEKYRDLSSHLLDDIQLQVLFDVCQFLNVFHIVQEIVSADKTPTLSVVIPIYEQLITMLQDLK